MRTWENTKRTNTAIFIGIVAVVLIIWLADTRRGSSCNVAYIKLHGTVVTYIPSSEAANTTDSSDQSTTVYTLQATDTDMSDTSMPNSDATSTTNAIDETASEDVTQKIRQAGANPNIKALVLEIDSDGGSPVGGQEIELALKRSQKPAVALIRGSGNSAAYMAATGANTIFASELSEVGDIGITESYVDNSKQDIADGLTFNQLSIGKYKDMFNPDKPLTADERTVAMKELQIWYQDFVQIVANNRHMSVSDVTSLADGASFDGEGAVQVGLIDKLGSVDDVRSYLTGKLQQSVVICGIDN